MKKRKSKVEIKDINGDEYVDYFMKKVFNSLAVPKEMLKKKNEISGGRL